MSWVKLDDRLPHHRKVRGLLPRYALAAYGLYVASVQFAQRHETDGRLLPVDLCVLVPTVPRPPPGLIQELVRVRLWDIHPEGGWVIHDYLEHNLSAIEREAGKRANNIRQQRRRELNEDVTRESRRDTRVSHGVVTGPTPVPSRPVPSRPHPVPGVTQDVTPPEGLSAPSIGRSSDGDRPPPDAEATARYLAACAARVGAAPADA